MLLTGINVPPTAQKHPANTKLIILKACVVFIKLVRAIFIPREAMKKVIKLIKKTGDVIL